MPITITEALADIKTTQKRIAAKTEHVLAFLYRQDAVRDPLLGDGGSLSAIERDRQAISDLEARIVALRRGIQRANDETTITINDRPRTISEWLIWRREIAGDQGNRLQRMRAKIDEARAFVRRTGAHLVPAGSAVPAKPEDIVINISESDLAKQIETLVDTLGKLDGMLSLKNATVFVQEGA